MFSSKIIKTKDGEASAVTRFLLKQFPCRDDEKNKKARARALKEKADVLSLADQRAQAELQAKQIIEQARSEADTIAQDAHKKGFSQGEQAGRMKAEAEAAPLIKNLKSISSEFSKVKESFYADHQDIILELALKIARKVIHYEIDANDELVLHVLSSALKLAIDREKLKIRLNPDDLELCLARRQDIMKNSDGIKQIIFEPDASVGKGGSIVEYAFGEIDARIEQQFVEVERELRAAHLDLEEMT